MHRRSIDLSSHIFAGIARCVTGKRHAALTNQIKSNVFIGIHDLHHSNQRTHLHNIYIYYNINILKQYCMHLITRDAGKLG